jgi:hypothetical protein
MGTIRLGELDHAEGVAERNGTAVAQVELRDSRRQESIAVPIAGSQQIGRKPGRITGFVGIRFVQIVDDDLSKHLSQLVSRQRQSEAFDFDVVLDNGTRIESCTIGGAQGSDSSRPGTYWFTLEF